MEGLTSRSRVPDGNVNASLWSTKDFIDLSYCAKDCPNDIFDCIQHNFKIIPLVEPFLCQIISSFVQICTAFSIDLFKCLYILLKIKCKIFVHNKFNANYLICIHKYICRCESVTSLKLKKPHINMNLVMFF